MLQFLQTGFRSRLAGSWGRPLDKAKLTILSKSCVFDIVAELLTKAASRLCDYEHAPYRNQEPQAIARRYLGKKQSKSGWHY
jgi:hypothetical protein